MKKIKSGYFRKEATTIEVDGVQKRVYPFVLTEEIVDRDGDRVIISGLNLKNFEQNPVVFKNHDTKEDPIGNILKIDKKGKRVIGYVHFHGLNEDSLQMERYVEARVYNAGSIGFRVTKSERVRATAEEREQYKFDVINNLTETELFEFSIVNIPANPNATQLKELQKMYKAECEAKEEGKLYIGDNIMENAIEKAGATLNKTNKKKLTDAQSLIGDVLNSAESEEAKSIEDLQNEISELRETIKGLLPKEVDYEEWKNKQLIKKEAE